MMNNFYFTSTGPENLYNSSKAITDNGYLYNLQDKSCDPKIIKEKSYQHISDEEKVNHPSHYTWLKEKAGIEVIDITRWLPADISNAVKYLLRQGHKHEEGMSNNQKAIEDCKKAIWYINDYINNVLKK